MRPASRNGLRMWAHSGQGHFACKSPPEQTRFAAMSQRFVRTKRRTYLLVSTAAFAVLVAQPTLGASRQSQIKRQEHEKAARKACLTGDYTSGVSILADLFVEHQDPAYIFNQGRCLEQNSRYKEAIARFEEFLRIAETSNTDADGRALAQRHIADCKLKLSEEEAPQAPQTSTQPLRQPAGQSVLQPPSTSPSAGLVKTDVTPAPSVSRGSGMRIAGIAGLAFGMAGIATGIVLNLKANSIADEMNNDTQSVYSQLHSRENTRSGYETLAWVGYGVGGACLAGGAVLTLLGYSYGGNRQVALAPSVAPGTVGVGLQGAF
jgi:tetratricopeptide (TPR) repeat protein